MSGPRLLLRYLAISLRGQMTYKASFLILLVGQFCITGVEFLVIVQLFERFGQIRGWTLPEVALLYGLSSVALGLASAMATGFDAFGTALKAGEFDRLLLRPRSCALQLAGQKFLLRRMGRLLQGLLVLGWALAQLEIAWGPAPVALLGATVLGGAALFYALYVLQATLAFWTTETLEVMNTLTYGGQTAMQYPVSIYEGVFRDFMLYVVPLACVNYFPALVLLGRPDPLGFPPWFGWVAPLVGPAFLLLALRAFRFGVGRYQSTGS